MALAAMIFLGGRKEAAKRNVIFLVVVVSSQENIYSLVDDKNHQEICISSFPSGFSRPPRKLSFSLAVIIGHPRNDVFCWRLAAKKMLVMDMSCLFSLKYM